MHISSPVVASRVARVIGLLVLLLTFRPSFADSGDAARRLVFLLQYIAADYPAAVSEGEIIDDLEYQEMVDFSRVAVERARELEDSMPLESWVSLSDLVSGIGPLVVEKVAAPRIRELVEQAIPILIEEFQIKPVPRELPNPERGAALYAEACATCHGLDGNGEGPGSADLEPPPAKFTDHERMASTAPYAFFNAITFGIDGTGMASFSDAYSDQERWDLAFYLWSFVASPGVSARTEFPPLALRDLATLSSRDLAPRIRMEARQEGLEVGPEEAIAAITYLRLHPSIPADSRARLDRVRRRLEQIRSLVASGEFVEATDAVTDAYFEDFEPLEPELDRLDSSIRRRFERTLIDFRKALRAGEGEAALDLADTLLEVATAASGVFAAPERRLSTGWFLTVLGVVFGFALIAMWWSQRRGLGNADSGV